MKQTAKIYILLAAAAAVTLSGCEPLERLWRIVATMTPEEQIDTAESLLTGQSLPVISPAGVTGGGAGPAGAVELGVAGAVGAAIAEAARGRGQAVIETAATASEVVP